MEMVRLGRTGLKVSKICLGTMTYGDPKWRDWVLDEAASRPFFRQAIEAGINFFDTADMYSLGASEVVTGKALKEYAASREEVMIATKLYNAMGPSPNQRGLSRKWVMTAIDNSLKRLGTDYVDLYQIHRFDNDTPIEETVEALHDVVKAGKARYVGASSMYAWQFATMLHVAEANGWTRFVSMQNYLNLLYREEEREMLPLCNAEGIGLIPWSPLARGRLTRPWEASTARSQTDAFGKTLFEEGDRAVVDRLAEVAGARGLPMARIALAWVLAKEEVSAPIVGATRPEHLDDAIAALDVELDQAEIASLEEPYRPHPVVGFN